MFKLPFASSLLCIFITGIALVVPSQVQAAVCTPPEMGHYTISQSCSFANTTEGNAVDGVYAGDLIIPEEVTLTVNAGQTVCWYPGNSIVLNGGNIAINSTGQLKECNVVTEMMALLPWDVYGSESPARIYDNNFFVCTSYPCTATAPSAEGNLILEGVLKMTGGNPGAGKVLTSDADGVASWGDAGAGGGGWTDGGTTVYTTTTTDQVAIGTTSPNSTARLTIQPDNTQFPIGMYILPSTHATSRRASLWIDNWQIGQDLGGTGTKDFFFWNSAGGTTLHITEDSNTISTKNSTLELTSLQSGNRLSMINFHGDDTYTDYSLRVGRASTGANAQTRIDHRGTGVMVINAVDAGSIVLSTSNTNRVVINSTGQVDFNAPSSGNTIDAVGISRFYRAAADIDTNNGGQIEVRSDGAGTNPFISFHKSGQWGAHFGLDDDNFFSTRGWSAGSTGYTSMKVGNRFNLNGTDPAIRFLDTDHNPDWFIYVNSGFMYFLTDLDGNGTWEAAGGTWPLYLTSTTAVSNDLECATCIDQGDLKTSTTVYSNTVPVGGALCATEYCFFPNIEVHTCANNSTSLIGAYSANAPDNYNATFTVYLNCTSGAWAARFRFVAASRDPEIFGWYDPDRDVIVSLGISEFNQTDRLPTELLEESPNLIPVQATIFDRDIARFGEEPDADYIRQNYTFTRVAKASELDPNDELIKPYREAYEKCMAEEKEKIDPRSPKSIDINQKCPQLITHPDIYYGKFEKTGEVLANWERYESEKIALAEKNKFVSQADLAENYEGAGDVEPGDIIAIDRNRNNFLVKATAADSQQLAGVMSTDPGMVLGQEQNNNIEMALVGRVPVKMSQSSLPVRPGDMITVSQEAGKGQKAITSGMVVGKALEAWEPNSGKDTVMVLLNTSQYDPQLVQKSLEGYQLARTKDGFQITGIYGEVVDRVLAAKDVMIANLEVGILKAHEIELAGVNLGEKLAELERRIGVLESRSGVAGVSTEGSQAVGSARLPANSRTVFVNETRVTAETGVLLTPRVVTNQHLAVTEVRPGLGFTVAVPQGGQEIPFDYWLVK